MGRDRTQQATPDLLDGVVPRFILTGKEAGLVRSVATSRLAKGLVQRGQASQ
jgi:hypothetical protein